MGTLKAITTNQQYIKYQYTYGTTTYSGIHTFTTKAGTQSIMPAISTTRVALSEINPSTIAATNVIAKTNACMHTYNSSDFYGFFYQGAGHPVFVNGLQFNSASDIPDNNNMFFEPKFWPSFCVKKDGTATIRWFSSKSKLISALSYCQCVIGSVHPLVYDSKDVLTQKVYDYDGVLICDPNNLTASNIRFNGANGSPAATTTRTFLGHQKGSIGVYIMVCVDTGMPLKVAANMMLDLGCDYAVNMDGGTPVQMRIKSGFGPTGKVTSNSGAIVNTAVCAFKKT